jgi:hypothetical protein
MSPVCPCTSCREASDLAQLARLTDRTYQRVPEGVLSTSIAFIA